MIEIIGFIAGILCFGCWVPQVLKVIKTKDTQSFTWWMQLTLTLGIALWIVFGVLVGSFWAAFFNACTLVCCLIILYYMLKNYIYKGLF